QRYHAAYASSLTRAVETAEIIAAPHGLEVVRVPALREVNFGAWEGLTRDEIVSTFGSLYDEWWRRPLSTRLPEGESYSEVVARSWGALRDIVRRHAGQQVLVVSHGGVIRALVGFVLGMDLNQFWRLRQDNGALNILDFSDVDRGVLVLFNDCSHLEDCRTPVPAWVR
ncbi:MAG: histidine phosphatase family protein, partial [Firmicutes bacterium]|nr:histidine phosphatase family protein [Bacillota bacterium]